jgi:hypothetical protein
MTVVIAASREKVPGEGRDDNTGFASFGFKDWDDVINNFFEDVLRRRYHFSLSFSFNICIAFINYT